MKVPAVIASFLALVVLAAGCGGGGGGSSNTESAQDWADGVCSAINTWTDSLRSASASVSGGNLSENSLTQSATDQAWKGHPVAPCGAAPSAVSETDPSPQSPR